MSKVVVVLLTVKNILSVARFVSNVQVVANEVSCVPDIKVV